MTQSRLLVHAVFVAVAVALASATAAGQGWEEAFNRLKAEVDQLREENQALRGEIEEMVGGEDGLAAQIGKIQADLGALNPGQNLWGGKVLRVGGSGFADAVIWGGEWRTRADYRFNASDLLDDVDDAGFRLDYRFNLGLGFVWGLRDGVEDGGNETRIKTWFEIQSAGRAANNTAESIASFQGASIGDFAARDNDLDFVRLYQAYILVENLLHIDGLQLKIGRQELKYGSKLIMGTNEFYTGTVHDAVRLDLPLPFLGDNASASVFYAKEAASDGQFPPGITTGSLLSAQFRASGDEDELFGLYVSDMEPLEGIALDFYYIYFNARSGNGVNVPNNITSANDPLIDAFGRATLGGRINTLGLWLRSDELVDNEGTLYTSIESAIQLGSSENDRDLTAWIIEVLVDWRLPFNTGDLKELRIHGGYYFAEGADAANDAGFSPLFISRHDNQPVHGRYGAPSRFGNLDLIPQTNVHVFHAGLKYNDFESKWTVGLAYYYAVRQHTTGLDDPLTISLLGNIYTDQRQFGHEFDLYAVKQLSTQIELFFNVSLFLPATDFIIQQSTGGSFQEVGTDPAFGAYAQIQVRF